jgi:O-antigen ligase
VLGFVAPDFLGKNPMINFLYLIENTLNNRILGVPRRWIEHSMPVWLPVLVIAGVLLLSVTLPFLASASVLILLIGLLAAIVGIMTFMHWPSFGLAALIITALIVPSPYLPGGVNLAVLLLALLIGLWLLDMILGQRDIRLVPSRTVRPLLALVLVATLSFGIGQLPWYTFVSSAPLDTQLSGLFIFVLSAGAFLLPAHQIRDLRWLQGLTWLYVGLGALFIAGWLLPGLGGITSRLFQLGATSNSLFWVWLVALALSQAVFNRKLHLGWRLALGGLVVATMYVAFVKSYDWKSGWLPALVVIAVIVALRSWRAGLAMALAGAVPALYLSSQALATDEYSYSTRLDAWEIMFEIIKVNPVTGLGPANYYWYTPLYRIRGWAVQFNSHNQYLDIVAQTGLLGLGCFLWFAGEVAWLGWRLRTRAPAGFAQAYVCGVLAGLAGTLAAGMLVDWILPFVYNIGLNGFRASILGWLFLGGLVSIEQIVRRQSQS